MRVRAVKENNFELQCIDAFQFLENVQDESVDLIVTDPPYESLEKHRAVGTTTRLKHSKASSNDWFPVIRNEQFEELFAHFYRILKPNSHFYLFCDQETMFVAKPIIEKVGFKFWKPLVWDKVAIGMGYHYRCRYEFILFSEKGKRKLNDLGVPDVLTAKRIRGGYPAEKPIKIVDMLIEQSSIVGEMVCDPFVGSGTTAFSALNLKRKFTGCDISQEACDSTRKSCRNF